MTAVAARFQTGNCHVKIIRHPPGSFVLTSHVQTKCKNKGIVLFEIHSSRTVSEPKTDNEGLTHEITSDTERSEGILHFKNRSRRYNEFIEKQVCLCMKNEF